MIPSTLFAIVLAALSSVASVSGAIVQRQGSFTYLTPTTTLSATPATSATTSATTRPTTTSSASTTPATSTQTTSSGTVVPPPVTTQTTSSGTVVPPPVTRTTATQSSPTTSVVPPVTKTTATTSPSPVITSGVANCDGVQQWQSAFAYSSGDRVIFNNQLFTAKQWTYNNAPPSHPDQWTAGGVCSQPIHNQADCTGVIAWDKSVAYTAGNKVTFNGHLWSAVQWTESNSPGDASGSWQDLGACA